MAAARVGQGGQGAGATLDCIQSGDSKGEGTGTPHRLAAGLPRLILFSASASFSLRAFTLIRPLAIDIGAREAKKHRPHRLRRSV